MNTNPDARICLLIPKYTQLRAGENSPCPLTRSKTPIRTYGCTTSSLARRAWHRLIAFELQSATFRTGNGTSSAFEFLLLSFGRHLLLVDILGGRAGNLRHAVHENADEFEVPRS